MPVFQPVVYSCSTLYLTSVVDDRLVVLCVRQSGLPQDGKSSMVSFGSGCPWSSTTCDYDSGGGAASARNIICNFGGHDGSDREAAVSADGTVIGPAQDYPGSGLGLRRFTGAMTGRHCS